MGGVIINVPEVQESRKILCAVYNRALHGEFLRLARMLDESGKYSSALYLGRSYDLIEQDIASCRDVEIAILPATAGRGTLPTRSGGKLARRRLQWLPRIVRELGKTAIVFLAINGFLRGYET